MHFTVNVLSGSNWSCCHAPAQSWANIQTGGHRSTHARANHTRPRKTHTPSPDDDSPRRVTRGWDSCLFFDRALLDMVTMCDLHLSIVVLAVGLALSLHCDMLASNLIICLARPHGSWIFFFFWQNLVGRGGDPHLMMSVI